MLKTQRMTKIKIIGAQEQLPLTVEIIHKLKLMHLLDHTKTEELDIGNPIGESERISGLLVKSKSLLSSFGVSDIKKENVSEDITEIENKIKKIAEESKESDNLIFKLNDNISKKKIILDQLNILKYLNFDSDILKPYNYLDVFIGTVTKNEGLESALSKITHKLSFASSVYADKCFVGVLAPKKHYNKIFTLLQQHGFNMVEFSDLSEHKGNPKEHIHKLSISIDLLEKDLSHAKEQQKEFAVENAGFLAGAIFHLTKEAEKSQAPLRFAETKYAFIIEGWVSSKEYNLLKKELEKKTNHRVHIEILPISETDKIPIVMKNMFFVKPFEFFMHLYTLPTYKEMDPSFFLFVTFPFFFGLMLGDVGYGFLTLILFSLLWWKMPKARNLLTAMMLCSVLTIFFGFVFGEYMGFESVSEHTGEFLMQYGIPLHQETIHGEVVYSFPRLMNRLHGEVNVLGNTLPTVLIIGVLLGFLHVNLGLFLGFINEVVSHGFKHAFFAKISWYVLELGVALVALSGLGMIPFHIGIGLAVIGIAAIMLFIGEGVQGLVEIPAIFTNILSYLRLGAVGLASVGLAVVVNEKLALPFMERGGVYIVVAILILILGHAVNIALGIIGPFLHSLRLHYVEFFSKFYKGGGIPFVAFGEDKET